MNAAETVIGPDKLSFSFIAVSTFSMFHICKGGWNANFSVPNVHIVTLAIIMVQGESWSYFSTAVKCQDYTYVCTCTVLVQKRLIRTRGASLILTGQKLISEGCVSKTHLTLKVKSLPNYNLELFYFTFENQIL